VLCVNGRTVVAVDELCERAAGAMPPTAQTGGTRCQLRGAFRLPRWSSTRTRPLITHGRTDAREQC
jgi:hypothetical protein